MKIVYIAGPYDASGYLSIDRNIAHAREVAVWLAEHGVGFICPHLNAAHFEVIAPSVPVEFWYELDLRLLDAADAILVLDGSSASEGTQHEIDVALAAGLPMFYEYDRAGLLAWAEVSWRAGLLS